MPESSFWILEPAYMTIICLILNLSKDDSESCILECGQKQEKVSQYVIQKFSVSLVKDTEYFTHGLWQTWWWWSFMTITSLIENSKKTPYGFEARQIPPKWKCSVRNTVTDIGSLILTYRGPEGVAILDPNDFIVWSTYHESGDNLIKVAMYLSLASTEMVYTPGLCIVVNHLPLHSKVFWQGNKYRSSYMLYFKP